MKFIKRLTKHKHIFIPIVYGLLNSQGEMDVKRGMIVAGGCVVPDDDLHFECLVCGKRTSITQAEFNSYTRVKQEVFNGILPTTCHLP